jgi:HAD superfamily hydrolase (TIGR01509 family)
MKTLEGILFDYGHTLVWFPKLERTHLTAARNVQRVLRDLGVSVEVSKARILIESYVPRPDGTSFSAEEEAKVILASAGVRDFSREDFQRIIDAEWRPYIENARVRNGVREALKRLKAMGLKLGIVANIWSGGMNPVLARLGIEGYFDTAVADMDVGFAKPDPGIFRLALGNLDVAPEQAAMVGDNPKTDIKGAHDLGMRTIRLMRGPNRTQPDCVEAGFKIRDFSRLAPIIHGLIDRDNRAQKHSLAN